MKLSALIFGQTGMRLILVMLLVAAPLLGAAAEQSHVKVTLLAQADALVPGQTVWLGVRLEHEPHWHTYWINPGDSGLPTKLQWQLPQGFRAAGIAWPVPTRIQVGDLYNFGYEGDMLLPVPVDVPATASPGATVHIGAEAKYLVCREECIPGKANLTLNLPVRGQAAPAPRSTQMLFAAAHAAQPQPAAWQGMARERADKIEITLRGKDLPALSDALLVQRKIVNYAPPQISRTRDEVTLLFAKSDYFAGAPQQVDMVLSATAHAWSVSVPFSSSP